MTILIDLSVAGVNTGPFNLYSDADDYTSAFATNITRQQLLDGYPAVVAAGTTNIKLQSLSDICPNDTILPVNATTSTTSSTSTSTSTTTAAPTTTTTTTAAPIQEFCVNWTAANEGNIRMSTQGYIDFTAVLAGRTIQNSPISAGNITGYIIAGMPPFTLTTPIPMTFTTTKAQWNTNSLPVVTDKVLTSLIYYLEVMFSDNSDYFIPNVNYSGQTNATITPGIQLTSSYNNCNTAPTANLTYANDVSPQPQCDSSVLVTISPNVNTLVTITSSFAPGGGALYLAGLPTEVGVTNIYSNLSNNAVNAGTTKKYRYGIAAGAGNTYTSTITIVVKNASTNATLATHVFTRTHDGTQC